MRLKHIKLSGFKSFVDATKVSVPNNLIGVVGPNGCGKSNVIDAIRWVMGESSAKTLRGDNMEDVIFNGSAARKPVNRVYVELVFDNAAGKAPGSYAKYAEIAIRRELVRDGGSKYFINKTRCRRKDIQDIFLGTGLGPRSYSIIEQGMVGRIVESKPEDLRVLIEEAAGISKYKERRRETENRIRHTRDNLSRVDDIIAELETQLRRLKRQANEAERYKGLKAEQRQLEQQLQTLKWADLQQQVRAKDIELARMQTDFEAHMTEQRDVESRIERMRQQQTELGEVLNQAQAEYYGIGGEVSALEQSIEHAQVTRQQQQEEFARLAESEQEANQHLVIDKQRLADNQQKVVDLAPQAEKLTDQYENVSKSLSLADQAYHDWQSEWESFNRDAAMPDKEREVQMARIEEHRRQIQHFSDRQVQVQNTLDDIDEKLDLQEISALRESVLEIDRLCQTLEQNLGELDQTVSSLRTDQESNREAHSAVRHQLQDDSAKLKSLEALQAAVLGEDNPQVNGWLEQCGISDHQRLASLLQISPGWELAVDTVLGRYVNALSVDRLDQYSQMISADLAGRVSLVDATTVSGQQATIHAQTGSRLDLLADKVTVQDMQIDGWLHGVYAADTLDHAMQLRDQLAGHESIVTREGCWVGPNWVSFGCGEDAETGILQREAEIEKLNQARHAGEQEMQRLQFSGEQIQQKISSVESQREERRIEHRSQSHKRTQLHNQLGAMEARSAELLAQREALLTEKQLLSDQLVDSQGEIGLANKLVADAVQLASSFDQRGAQLARDREKRISELENARSVEREVRDQRQACQIELERLQSSVNALNEGIDRTTQQLARSAERRAELSHILESDTDPTEPLRVQLQSLLESRLASEARLSKARDALAEFESEMQGADQQRLSFTQKSKLARDGLESVKMLRQEVAIRRDTVAEQLQKDTEEMTLLHQQLAEGVSEQDIEADLQQIQQKLTRIGAVNLVAIDEFDECKERKVYLDQQHADLSEAMATLEAAINKIDKETRTRFKETFDALNEGFKGFFPKLFGGGKAYLELTGNDLLDTGVAVMARPPGKRNSTINLLSGGEKALAAVSLLFAFFDLNPAPFCVLDEVDAPLDDVNVERYAGVLKQLGEKTQLIFITHNKITMEVADILVGVTMAEAGVSRLVSVDIAEASALAVQ